MPADDSESKTLPVRSGSEQQLILTYLDIKGFAEPIRLALRIGAVPFHDIRVSYEQIAEMRAAGKLPFGQVPTLQITNKTDETDHTDKTEAATPLIIGQSQAILRWVGQRTGLLPQPGSHAALLVDSLLEALSDIHKALIPAWYKHACGRSPVNGCFYHETALTDEQHNAVLHALNSDILPARFAQIERVHSKLLADMTVTDKTQPTPSGTEAGKVTAGSGGMFLCGPYLSIADLVLYTLVKGLQDERLPFCVGVTAPVDDVWPLLRGVVRRVGALQAVQDWEREHSYSQT